MWYVIQVTGGKEDKMLPQIAKVLESFEDIELFIPRYICMHRYKGEWHQNHVVLFPGYIFLDTDSKNVKDIQKVLRIFTGLVEPVCIGGGFYPIREEEQAFLKSITDEHYVVQSSVGYLVDGELIVTKGPLCRGTDRVKRIDRHKRIAELAVPLWGENRRVVVGLEVIKKMTSAEWTETKAAEKV